jgi:hypothetical protein
MPDFVKKENGELDYSKLFMGLAIALVYVMQSYHAMQVADIKANVVPRAEYEVRHDETMNKDEILNALLALNKRLDTMEKK